MAVDDSDTGSRHVDEIYMKSLTRTCRQIQAAEKWNGGIKTDAEIWTMHRMAGEYVFVEVF